MRNLQSRLHLTAHFPKTVKGQNGDLMYRADVLTHAWICWMLAQTPTTMLIDEGNNANTLLQ